MNQKFPSRGLLTSAALPFDNKFRCRFAFPRVEQLCAIGDKSMQSSKKQTQKLIKEIMEK
jgi:hypothetical protein